MAQNPEKGDPLHPRKGSRILLKVSGEAFSNSSSGVEPEAVEYLGKQLATIHTAGLQVGVVIGGGNIVRGSLFENKGMNRCTADHMGMLGTLINALALQDAIEHLGGIEVRVLTALTVTEVAEPFILRKALEHLNKNRIVIFACGTGNPYFTTDTAAALRATEIGAELFIKATKENGIYSADPKKYPKATLYRYLTYQQILDQNLRVMDLTAITLCREQNLPILVFNYQDKTSLTRYLNGEPVGTFVCSVLPIEAGLSKS
ncbi:MAG: UMP kinase [Planctomycetota bacterium]|mgnify:FL=1